MKELIFKLWIINLLISIVLYAIYRIAISKTDYADAMNFFEKIAFIFNVLLSLWCSTLYLIAMFFCSLMFFFNLIEKIRDNHFLSFLSFLGIPSACVIYLIVVNILTHFEVYMTFLVFSIIYLILTTIEFLIFRRKINSHDFFLR
jgi:hypothetical protein